MIAVGELEFQQIYTDFQARIFRYLARLVGEHDAEDLTQEVFVKVSRALKTFRGDSELSTWIYRIATNEAIDKLRSSSFRQEAQEDPLEDSDELAGTNCWTAEETQSVDEQVSRLEMYECFGKFVMNLPAKYRTVVVLSELEELPNKTIAEILGLGLEVVKMRLHRGRGMLLQELKAHCKAEDWL
jgi:RNA polymerase sigma-70 factor (ECF subfamily)